MVQPGNDLHRNEQHDDLSELFCGEQLGLTHLSVACGALKWPVALYASPEHFNDEISCWRRRSKQTWSALLAPIALAPRNIPGERQDCLATMRFAKGDQIAFEKIYPREEAKYLRHILPFYQQPLWKTSRSIFQIFQDLTTGLRVKALRLSPLAALASKTPQRD